MRQVMRMIGAGTVCGAVTVAAGWGGAQPAAPALPKAVIGKTFAVAPVTTDLQRRLLGGTAVSRAVVIVEMTALFRDGKTVDLEALELDIARKALSGYAPDKGRSVVHPHFHYGPGPNPPRKGIELLELALEGEIRYAGFVPAVIQTNHHNGEFSLADYVAPLRDATGVDADEDAVGDERVKAYPVRTPLSRVLTESAAGVADVRVRLGGGMRVLPEGVDESVRSALRALRLPRGSRVNFRFTVGDRGQETSDWLRGLVLRWTGDEGLTAGPFAY